MKDYGKIDLEVSALSETIWDMASKVWSFAELGFAELKRSAYEAGVLVKAGFRISDRGICGIDTSWIATWGQGAPVLGILVEFDALPDLGNEAVPTKTPRKDGGTNGHGCGHNLIGAGAIGAAIALRKSKDETKMRTLACRTIVVTRALCAGLALCLSHPALAVDSAAPQPAVGEPSASPNPTDAERIRILEQQVRMLQERLEQLESAAMAGRPAALATEPQAATETAEQMAGEGVAAEATAVSRESSPAEVRDEHVLLTGAELISEEFPGSWPMFGTDLRMKVGGYLKADLVYDVDGTTDRTQFLMSTIPVRGTPEFENDGYIALFSRETRFNIDVRRTTPDAVPLRMFVEGDFWSSGNQFRLRHAYLTAGNFVAGQTWTTLSFLESLPFMIDFAAGDALFGGRATQIRYQRKVSDRWKFAVALEGLDLLGIENPHGLPGKASAQLPLFAARADYHWKSGLLLMGSSVAQLRWDGGADGPSDTALQFDAVVAGRQYLGPHNYVTWNVSYGEGSGENIMAFAGSEANAVLGADGRLETIPAFATVLGYWHRWSEDWSSNVSYAYGWLDAPESRDPLALKRGGIGHVNLIWQPLRQFSTGLEYMWGAKRAVNDALGNASRVQGMVKFEF